MITDRPLTDEFVLSLHGSAPYRVPRIVVGKRLSIASSSETLIHSLLRLIPETDADPRKDGDGEPYSCLIEFSSRVPGWREYLSSVPDRVIDTRDIGLVRLRYTDDFTVIEQENIGIFFRFRKGAIMILINDDNSLLESGQSLNVAGLAVILSMEMAFRGGRILVHGGAVSSDGMCTVFTGESGAGKTTRVLDLAFRGWDFMGDDMLILGRGEDNEWNVWPYFQPVKISENTSRMFPELSGFSEKPGVGPKRIVSVDDIPALKKGGKSTLHRIFFLTTESETVFRQLSEEEGLQYLSRTFLSFFIPESAPMMLDNILDIISAVPVYVISRGYINSMKERLEQVFC